MKWNKLVFQFISQIKKSRFILLGLFFCVFLGLIIFNYVFEWKLNIPKQCYGQGDGPKGFALNPLEKVITCCEGFHPISREPYIDKQTNKCVSYENKTNTLVEPSYFCSTSVCGNNKCEN